MLLEYLLEFMGIYMLVLFFLKYAEGRKQLADPKPKRFPTVSIIVPAWNEEKTLAKTIDSLLEIKYPKGKLEIIVVNDGSTDKTLEVARNYEYKYKRVIVLTKENGGKGSAMNLGIETATRELIASMDADSFATPDSLKRMIAYFEDPVVAAVSPMMKVYKPKTRIQKLQRVEYMMMISMRKVLSFFDGVPVTPGPLSIYRASVFKELGGFEEDNITEDQEMALRIQKAHYRLKCAVTSVVYTSAPPGFRTLLQQRVRWNRGWLYNVLFRKENKYINLMKPKYGDFGVLFALSFIGIFLSLTVITYGFSEIIWNWINHPPIYYLLGLIDSDITHSNFALFYMFIKPLHLFLVLLLLFTTIWMFFVVKTISKESDILKYYLGYVSIYLPMMSFFWIITILYEIKDLIFGRKYKWYGKE